MTIFIIAIQFILKNLCPEKYDGKIAIETDLNVLNPYKNLTIEEMDAEIAIIKKRLEGLNI